MAKRAGSLLLTLFQQLILIHKLFFFSRRISLTKKSLPVIRFSSLNLRSEQASKYDTLFSYYANFVLRAVTFTLPFLLLCNTMAIFKTGNGESENGNGERGTGTGNL